MSLPRITKYVLDTKAAPGPGSMKRFVFESKARIGKCITFGCSNTNQLRTLGFVLRHIDQTWRRYAAGQDGYITTKEQAGLWKHRIAWGDHDQMGHVNNVRYNFWAETARINWVRKLALRAEPAQRRAWEELWTPRGTGLILKSIKTEYKVPLQYPDSITVLHRLLTEPTAASDQLRLEAVVLSERHQRVAARLTEEIVVYDYAARTKVPLPSFMVDALAQIWAEQQLAAVEARRELYAVDDKIRMIEKETWDRRDAVEDLGSAAGNSEDLKR